MVQEYLPTKLGTLWLNAGKYSSTMVRIVDTLWRNQMTLMCMIIVENLMEYDTLWSMTIVENLNKRLLESAIDSIDIPVHLLQHGTSIGSKYIRARKEICLEQTPEQFPDGAQHEATASACMKASGDHMLHT